jgi:CRISPR/Cas system CSM-associated protein Csm4 (group 5 of RAMP superfamily)
MIKSITPVGQYIIVSNNMSSTYINGYSGLQGVGNMRYNTSSQNMEVFDGNNWVMLSMSIPSIGLNGDAESLLDWAKKKRDEELELEKMANENLAIKDLVNQIKSKQDQLKMVQTLIKKETTV